ASSPNDMYFVGSSGGIVHYDGSVFRRMESGHDVRFTDAEGTLEGEYVFIVGYTYVLPVKTQAVMIHDGRLETLYYSDDIDASPDNGYGAVSSVSVYQDTAYFVTDAGFWKYNYITGKSTIIPELGHYGYHDLKVQGLNDIFTLGGGFNYVHYNGVSWKYNRYLLDNYDMSANSARLKGDKLVMVGFERNLIRGIIIKGTRF
ncbi:MAG: hypothetical protein ACE5D0_11080, partial [Fidelibacterota bacterium]